STQIKDFFGLSIENVPSEFLERMGVLVRGMNTASLPATATSIVTLVIIIVCPRLVKVAVPGTIVALLVTTAVCVLFGVPVETIGSRFGGIPTGLPAFEIPRFRPDL